MTCNLRCSALQCSTWRQLSGVLNSLVVSIQLKPYGKAYDSLTFSGFSLRQVCVYDMSLPRPYGKRRLQVRVSRFHEKFPYISIVPLRFSGGYVSLLGSMLLGTSGHLVKPCETDPIGQLLVTGHKSDLKFPDVPSSKSFS